MEDDHQLRGDVRAPGPSPSPAGGEERDWKPKALAKEWRERTAHDPIEIATKLSRQGVPDDVVVEVVERVIKWRQKHDQITVLDAVLTQPKLERRDWPDSDAHLVGVLPTSRPKPKVVVGDVGTASRQPVPARAAEDPVGWVLGRPIDTVALGRAMERSRIEDGLPPVPRDEPVVPWRIGYVRVRDRCHADSYWFAAMRLRRDKEGLTAEDVDRLLGYQRGPDAVGAQEIIAAVEAAFPAWERAQLIKEWGEDIARYQSRIKQERDRTSPDPNKLRDLIAKRERARQERDTLIRERDGLPPTPLKAPRNDLSAMSPEEKKKHKNEQARLRMERRRQRQKADGDDLVTRQRGRLGGQCLVCGEKEDLELHHRHGIACETCLPIEDTALSATQQRKEDPIRPYRIAAGLDDDEIGVHFGLLCASCHRDLTRGLVTLRDVETEDAVLDGEDETGSGW